MAHVKLFGLVLLITTLFLSMVAVITGTTTIRLPGWPAASSSTPGDPAPWPPGAQAPPAGRSGIDVPVIHALGLAAVVGLGMWFLSSAAPPGSTSGRKRPRRRR